MDKTILKKFAIESRHDLIEKIKNKINTFYVNEEFSKEQRGDLYVLSNEKHSLSLSREEYEKRELLIKRIKELSLEQVIEEAAYTWFNRIIAIRYMEKHDYLPLTKDNQSLGIRVLSSKDNTPDPEILKFTNLTNPELDIDFKKEKYAELKDDNEKFKYVLLLVCKKLGRVIPQVFDGVTDYIDILMPDNLLNDTGFVTKVIKEIPEDNFNQVEIIGWLYQYYNQNEKDKAMSKEQAYSKNEIPYVTQLFTPDWIVKYMVENSLGRYWVEHSENDSITDNWKYFIKDNIEKENQKIYPTEITFIDPCCGSGHILVYAFEVFYQIYLQAGYNKKDIPELILKNNLYGLDIDDRAGQLSILSVLLKAREYDKEIFNKEIVKGLNIMSIPESNTISQSLIDNISSSIEKEQAQYLIDNFKNAKEIGSLLILENKDYSELERVIDNDTTIFGLELKERFLPIIKAAIILSRKYNIVVTNPPYMNASSMPDLLKKYLTKYYKDSKSDLCTAFMEFTLLNKNGYYAIINQHSWMFLSTFANLRLKIIKKKQILNMLHLGTRAFEEINGEVVQTTSLIMSNGSSENLTMFVDLREFSNAKSKEIEFLNIKSEGFTKNTYYMVLSNILNIPSYPFAYWISKAVINNFNSCKYIDDFGTFTGSQNITGNNNKYLRMWWEVNSYSINSKWYFYAKGGEYRKYYGNIEIIVDWSDKARNFYQMNKTSNLLNKNLWFKKGITYSAISSVNPSFRLLNPNCIFDKGGPSIILEDFLYSILGLLNSKIASYYLNIFNPTLNIQTKDVKSIPIKISDQNIEIITKEQVHISKQDWDSFETSWNFKKHPLLKNNYEEECLITNDLSTNTKISDSFRRWEEYTEKQFNTLKKNEEELNRIFIDIYGLQDELTKEVEDKDVTIRKSDQEREIRSLISYAVGCMFGRYSLDQECLVYAGGDFDKSKYKTFEVDNDNVIPITDEAYFKDDIVERFKNFISIVYGKDTLNENLDFIAETLGKRGTETSEDTIRRYFVNDFFNDHVKIYQKRPIYWLFDSGKKNGFKALIYMHRYNENLVSKIRVDYLHRMQTTYEKLLSDVNDKLTTELSMTDKKEAQKRQADLNAKLQEIKEYDEKIAHIANQKINIDLDDGIKVNYGKFKDILAKIK